MGGRTYDHYIDHAPHSIRAASKTLICRVQFIVVTVFVDVTRGLITAITSMSTHVRVTVPIKKNVDHKPPPLLLIPTSVRRSVNGQQYGMCVRAYKPDDDSW